MKRLLKCTLLIFAFYLTGCTPQTVWYQGETSISIRDRDLAECKLRANRDVPYPTTSTSNPTKQSESFLGTLGQSISKAGQDTGAALQYSGRIDRLTALCMEAQGYKEVNSDSEEARAIAEYTLQPAQQNYEQSYSAPSAQSGETDILLFGGEGHKTFLGCLTCSELSTLSVFNELSDYGNHLYSGSIYNRFGDFGSSFSKYSACNTNATDPPVIVDENGTFYGRLTINRYHNQATEDEAIVEWLENIVCEE